VGVVIAIIANTWMGRIVPPFLWGIIWTIRLAVLPLPETTRWRRKALPFYSAEFLKATGGSLVLSLFLGSLKALLRRALLG
jgi:hypothetical protein